MPDSGANRAFPRVLGLTLPAVVARLRRDVGLSVFADALDHVAEPLELVERAMREQLATQAEVIAAVGDHVLASGGKRMRPAILLRCSRICSYTDATGAGGRGGRAAAHRDTAPRRRRRRLAAAPRSGLCDGASGATAPCSRATSTHAPRRWSSKTAIST
jgi:hypothetical protein